MARHNNRRNSLHRMGLLAAGLVFPRLNALAFQEKRSGHARHRQAPPRDHPVRLHSEETRGPAEAACRRTESCH